MDDEDMILFMIKKIEKMEKQVKELNGIIQEQKNTIDALEKLLFKDVNQLEY